MNKLKINGYRLYGDAEIVIVQPPEENLSVELQRYIAPPVQTIELRVNSCKFNKGNQKGKNLSKYMYDGDYITVAFRYHDGDEFEGVFCINQCSIDDKISFTAIATGALTFTPGES